MAATSLSLSSAIASRVSARTRPARLPKWCKISGCEIPAAAAMSCNRSPSGPVRAIAACAALRISRLAWSGVPAPLRLGTKDLGSFFEGGLTRVRLWNRALAASEISALYATDLAPKVGLVGEFLLSVKTGTTAVDTAQENNGNIFKATWETQK